VISKPRIAPAHDPDTRIYIECMTELRERLHAVMWLAYGEQVLKGTSGFVQEAQLLQLRMVLELIAFSSLTANQEKYAAVFSSFDSHWKAAKMLAVLEKVNPHFYPTPVRLKGHGPVPSGRERARYEVLKDGFLTRVDFVFLYDACSAAVHARNPFSARTSVEIKYDFPVWVERIRSLLRIHFMHFVDDRRWLVYVPEAGRIQVFTVMADPSVV
jgi:hypothetical protein